MPVTVILFALPSYTACTSSALIPVISGTTGYIVVEAPWWKTAYFEVHHENPNDVEKFSERFLDDGLRYEISDFLSMINGSNKSEFKLTRGESIAMAEVMEGFLRENR